MSDRLLIVIGRNRQREHFVARKLKSENFDSSFVIGNVLPYLRDREKRKKKEVDEKSDRKNVTQRSVGTQIRVIDNSLEV